MKSMVAKDNSSPPTRQTLLARLQNPEDRQSWDEFAAIYSKLIFSVALQAGLNQWEAQEVLQETLLGVSKTITEYQATKGRFKSWLLRLTSWRITDQFRKRQRHIQRSIESSTKSSRTPTIARIADPKPGDLEAIWEREWTKNLFAMAVDRVKRLVNAKQFEVFELYIIKQWPAAKVAKVMDIPPGQVYLAKHRILALVKKEVRKLEDDLV
ncbi:MAG: sigma-70 family RNA polymerase sigma factor [Verrucomicrobiota bacterium]